MSRFEKTDCSPQKIDLQNIDWWQENITNPFFNALVVEPANAVSCTLDAFSHQSGAVPRIKPLAVARSNDLGSSICQGGASAVGSVLPYALSGKFAGSGLRYLGSKFEVEGALAKFAQSDKAAQIIGAGVYDGMRETHDGETHLRNGAAGAVNFMILENFGRLGKGRFEKMCYRFGTGGCAAVASNAIARPDLYTPGRDKKNSEIDSDRLFFTGALLNVLLPGTQHGVRAIHDAVSVKLGNGIPLDRFIQSKERTFAHAFSSPGDRVLLDANRWARVQPVSEANSYHAGKDLVSLKNPGELTALRHELQHRKEIKEKIAEPGFERAAELLKTDRQKAWSVFRTVRQAQEIRAELANYRVNGQKTYSQTIKDLKQSIPNSGAAHGDTYETLWRKEFKEFEKTGGKFRPKEEFSGNFGFKMFNRECDQLYAHLFPSHPKVGTALSMIEKRYDIPVPQLTLALKHVNEFLDPNVVHATQLDVDRIAMQTLRLIGSPEKVSQGKHPTCAPASLEYYTYLKHPENAADLISQVVRLNQFECLDGAPIVVNGLNVVPEKYWNRNHANQLFQNTAINVYWQRKKDLSPWILPEDKINMQLRPGLTRYQRQWSHEMNESPYRLLDYSKFPPAPVHSRVPGHESDLSCPLMNLDTVEDIHNQISGTAHGGVTLSEKFSNAVELADVLREREQRSQLPVIAWVDTRQPLLAKGSGSSTGGGHAVVIKSYDPISKRVAIFNPWGEMLNDVRIKDLYQATQDFDETSIAVRKV